MKDKWRKDAPSGFTLVELMIVIALIGILASIAVPMMKNYVIRAKYSTLNSVLHQLMDGQDTYFLENGSFYPDGSFGRLRINAGEEIDIPELGYKFPSSHSNQIVIQTMNFTLRRGGKVNLYTFTVDTDFDSNGNGRNDRYIVTTDFRNEAPRIQRGVEYYRYIRQVW